jgi:hypothetical protein
MWIFLLIALIAYFALGGGQGLPIQHGPAPALRLPQPRLEPVPLPMVLMPEPAPEREALMLRIRRVGIAPGQGRRADLGM